MKNFKQLVRELPSNKVVCAFGQFQPPTAGHELLVKAVQQIAGSTADHVIYASANEDKKLNPLPADRKVYFLKRMFSEGNFQATEVDSIVEVAFDLNKKYKHITVVASSDKVADYETELKEHNGHLYNFDSIKVVSCGDIDPDNNTVSAISGVKMCESAKQGNFNQFKKGVPHTLTELDSRRLMNDVRKGMGLEPIRETVLFERSKIREQFVAGKIFNVGDRVQDEAGTYEIMDRGANYITVVNESGELSKKWIDKVTVAETVEDNHIPHNPNEFTFKGYTTTQFHKEPRAHKAFAITVAKHNNGEITDGVAVLNAIKHTDAYLQMIDGKDHDKAQEALKRIGEFENHRVYWDDHKPTVDSVIAHQKDDQARAVKEESEVLDKKKVALNYKEFIKKSMSSELPVEFGEPVKGDGKLKPKFGDTIPNESDMEKDEAEEQTKAGHTLGHSRRQKVALHTEEHDDQYEMATGFKAAAEHSMAKGNMGGYHAHMANHHDHMGAWHERKGRSAAAEKEYDKAAEHHDKSLKHPYVSEAVHRIALTVTDPNHAMVSKRKETIQRTVRVTGDDKQKAINGAIAHYRRKGYKVHDHNYIGTVNEELDESFSSIEHNGDHKKITHGADFEMKIGKEHHDAINNLKHGDRHTFKCMADNEYGCWRDGDNLHFKRHSHDSGVLSNMSVMIPAQEFQNPQDEPKLREDIYTSDIRVKKVQVQDKDGNWVFKDRKSHPHRVNFAASKMGAKPAQPQQQQQEHIEKVAGGYEVESEHGNKNLGKSKTLAGAKKRLKQVEYFKHMGEETVLNFESWVLKQKTTSSVKKDKKETEKASKAASGVEFKNKVQEAREILKKKKKKEIEDKEVTNNNNTSAVYDPFTPTP